MARYIDADKLFRYVDEQAHLSKGKLAQYIRENHTSNVMEVKHGHWQRQNGGFFFLCSVCGKAAATKGNYCHSCGARMDGKGDA